MNKVKSFVKQFVAVVTGDDNAAKAQKALRQADSALKTQIASLTGDIITLEDAVTTAKENQTLARVNKGNPITDRTNYVEGLLASKNKVTLAEEALKTHKDKIAFLEGELGSLNEDVDAAEVA